MKIIKAALKRVKITGLAMFGYLMSFELAWAHCPDEIEVESFKGVFEILPISHGCPNGVAIPEIDGSGTILALGLVAGLVALIRERYFRK